jgi:class 3 adenylate cyclase/predicted ATPase
MLSNTARWKLATVDADLTFPNAAGAFSCSLGAPITEQDTPRLYVMLRRVLTDAGFATFAAKDKYQHARPFMLDGQPICTPADLEKLGVPLGHRKLLLKAIANLGAVAGATVAAVAPTSGPMADTAERRHVTVMFSDLVGSTALSARMDPEDLREVISTYQRCVAETVRRFDGFVAKYLGDGVLAYFGYPQAHEDDAERAVRAALELTASVSGLKSRVSLQTRVGIATGLVVVGNMIGSGEAQERGIVGETPNLAARLQGIAEPNTVVIAEGTRKLLGNLFELEDLGARDLKGIAEPVRAWAALRASSVANHFEALHAAGLTALVGREEECELLMRRWARAKNGEGQVVLLSGEAGIGKSRLTAALMERLGNEPHTRLRYFCSPQHTDDALFPIIGEMERAVRLMRDDTPQAKLDKLDALLAYNSTSAQDASLFAEMLSLPNDGRYPEIELTPQQRRQRMLEALVAQIEVLARSRPVLMIFEDAQWTDPTSLEALGRMVDRVRTLRVLLIVTFRPEFDPPWIGQSHVTALILNRLAQREVGVMIDHVVGDKPLPASARQDIVERSDGVPLFIEEMTKAVLEAAGDRETAGTVSTAVPSPSLAVPATLHASLMARLDRLGPAREVAQIGAAIGREFSYALLAAVARRPETELGSSLDRLVQSGLLFRRGMPPDATYLFKHALVQDAAYGALLREPRRALHARIVETLESQFAEEAERQPARLARHCSEAGLIEKAAGLWGKAGARSMERSALVEATEQFTRAVDQIASLPSTAALRGEQIELQVALANALMFAKGFAAPETRAALERGRLLIEQVEALGEESPVESWPILVGFWAANLFRFNGDACRELAAQELALAEKQRKSVPLVIGHYLTGYSLALTGDIAEARAHFDRAIELYDPVENCPLGTRFRLDYRVASLSYRSIVLWSLGFPAAALADAERALKYAHEIGHALTLMNALGQVVSTHLARRDYATAKAVLAELALLADEKGAAWFKAYGVLLRSFVSAETKEAADHVHAIASAWDAYLSTGATLLAPMQRSYLAMAYADIGQFDDARKFMGDAITATEKTKERFFESEVHRVAGEIELLSPERDMTRAEGHFQRALEIARAQQTRSWELRAATSLARLWRDQGRRAEAHDLLASVYGWFTEGFDTLDLKEAKALLEELSS